MLGLLWLFVFWGGGRGRGKIVFEESGELVRQTQEQTQTRKRRQNSPSHPPPPSPPHPHLLEPVEVRAQAVAQEAVGAEGRDREQLAHRHELDAVLEGRSDRIAPAVWHGSG